MAIQVNLRVSEELRDQLAAAAEARGVSMNREINNRLERSFREEENRSAIAFEPALRGVLDVVGAAMELTRRSASVWLTGTLDAPLMDVPLAYSQAVKAANQVFEAFAPPATGKETIINEKDFNASVDEFRQAHVPALLNEAATGKPLEGLPYRIAAAKALHAAIGKLADRLGAKRTDKRK